MFVTGGLIAQLAGIAGLREAQRRESRSVWAGSLALLAASVWLMGKGLGWELGVSWALTTISVAAWILILHPFFRAEAIGHNRVPRMSRRVPNRPSGVASRPSASRWRLAIKLISAGPFYLIAALGLSLLLATKPWTTELTRLFIGGLSTPFFWSIGALHSTVDLNLWRVVLVPIALSIVTFGVFFLS